MIRVKELILVGGFNTERRGTRAIVKRAMFDMAKTWHKKFLPGHFKRGAPRKYKYQKREPLYEARKRFDRKPPLVWTGLTRASARVLFRVTGSFKTVTGKFTLPQYIRMRTSTRRFQGKTYILPAMGAEITHVLPQEQAFLNKRMAARVVKDFRKLKTREVIKIG